MVINTSTRPLQVAPYTYTYIDLLISEIFHAPLTNAPADPLNASPATRSTSGNPACSCCTPTGTSPSRTRTYGGSGGSSSRNGDA